MLTLVGSGHWSLVAQQRFTQMRGAAEVNVGVLAKPMYVSSSSYTSELRTNDTRLLE